MERFMSWIIRFIRFWLQLYLIPDAVYRSMMVILRPVILPAMAVLPLIRPRQFRYGDVLYVEGYGLGVADDCGSYQGNTSMSVSI